MKTFLLFACSLLVIQAPAQKSTEEIHDTFLFKFHFSEGQSDIIQAFFAADLVPAIPQTQGKVYAIYSDKNVHLDQPQGIGEVVQDGDWAQLKIQLNDSPDTRLIRQKMEGIIALPVEVPPNPDRRVFYDLVKNDIYLVDVVEGKSFYGFQEIIYPKNGPQQERELLKSLLSEVQFVAREMRRQMDSPVAKGGRFQGIDLFTAMEKSTTEDLRSFLRYVQTHPRKYQGADWKFAEIYATWIDAGTPAVLSDIEELLLKNSEQESAFNRYLNSYSTEQWPALAEHFRDKAIASKDAKMAADPGLQYAKVALQIAEKTQDQEELGWSWFTLGELDHELDQLDRAIQHYEKAISFFEPLEDKGGLIVTYNNLSRTLNKTATSGNFKKAISLQNQAIEMADYFKQLDTGRPLLAQVYRNLGDSYVGLKKYKKAIQVYETGLNYTQDQTALSLKRRAVLFFQLSEVYSKMNKSKEAKDFEKKAIEAYRRMEEMAGKSGKS